jgi:hypothetical protein
VHGKRVFEYDARATPRVRSVARDLIKKVRFFDEIDEKYLKLVQN